MEEARVTLYDDLGIEPGADDATIKRAYRSRAKKAHPDQGGDPEEFKKLNEAKIVLLDPRRRQKYDETGETDASPDNEFAEIINIATSAIDYVLNQIERRRTDPCTYDIVKDARTHVDNTIDGEKEKLRNLEAGVASLKKLAERMKSKPGKTNRLRPIFEARIGDHQRRTAAAKAGLERLKAAYALLDEHTFDATSRPEPASDVWACYNPKDFDPAWRAARDEADAKLCEYHHKKGEAS